LPENHDVFHDAQQRRHVLVFDRVAERVQHGPVDQSQHIEDVLERDFGVAVGHQLIENAFRIADTAVGRARNGVEGVVGRLHALGLDDLAQQCDQRIEPDPAEVVPLAARDDGGQVPCAPRWWRT
jgi:hypothetical protein